jgi:hypothetical protein
VVGIVTHVEGGLGNGFSRQRIRHTHRICPDDDGSPKRHVGGRCPFAPGHKRGVQRRCQELADRFEQLLDLVAVLRRMRDRCPKRPVIRSMQNDRVHEPCRTAPQDRIQQCGCDPQRHQHRQLPRIALHKTRERCRADSEGSDGRECDRDEGEQ